MAERIRRAMCYPPDDLASTMCKDRVMEVLEAFPEQMEAGINDAIELYECYRFINRYAEAYDEAVRQSLVEKAPRAKGEAYKLVHQLVARSPLDLLYAEVEATYRPRFWNLLEESSAYKAIDGQDFVRLLDAKPRALRALLEHKRLIEHFDANIRTAILHNPNEAAELIILGLAATTTRAPIFLPKSLSREDIDWVMMQYIQSPDPNPNFTQLLLAWPASESSRYSPSPNVKVTAEKRTAELNKVLFSRPGSVNLSIAVQMSFVKGQRECLRQRINGTTLDVQISQDWLDRYTGYETILTNLIWIFSLVDSKGRISAAAHPRERSAIISTLGLHPKDEYPQTAIGNLYGMHQHAAISAYRSYLTGKGVRFENVLEWCFGEYFAQEFGVDGLTISLPSEGTTYLDRCKAMGPELERVAKGYTLFVQNGSIDPAYFNYLKFGGWDTVPSLVQDKYAVAGKRFDEVSSPLLSDQSLLSYVPGKDDSRESFFEAMSDLSPRCMDYDEAMRSKIDILLEAGIVKEGPDETLEPTLPAYVLYHVWHEGAIVMPRLSKRVRSVVESLVADEILAHYSNLLAPDESNYFDYMLNNARYSDALALRNKYDHATFSVSDPDAKEYMEDYIRFLELVALLVLKINDDLILHRGTGVDLEWVDLPYLDRGTMQESGETCSKAI